MHLSPGSLSVGRVCFQGKGCSLRVRMGVESRRAKPVTAGLAHSDPRMPLAFDLLTVPQFRPEGVSHGPLGRDLQFQSVDRKMN